jgi:hypothetical protein
MNISLKDSTGKVTLEFELPGHNSGELIQIKAIKNKTGRFPLIELNALRDIVTFFETTRNNKSYR